MSRFENDWDRDRERERDRDRERSYDQERGRQQFGPHREGSGEQRRGPDIGRSNEYGSHAGWGGQGFNQGSFGSYGGQGERFYSQHGGQGFGAEHGYSGRETGGGMSTYQGPGSDQGWNAGNFERGRGSERWGSQYGQGSEGWRSNEHERGEPSHNQRFSGREGGWGGYGSYDREPENRNQGWSGSQGWVGGQRGYGPGSTSQSGESRGRHYGRGPKGWQRSDDRIREDISERLADHPDVDASEIEIEVRQGEVILKGSVDDRHAKRMAEDIAENVSGVRDVQNQIRVSRGFWGAVKDTFTGGDSSDDRQTASDRMSTSQSGSSAHTITPNPRETTPQSGSSGSKESQPAGGTRK